MKCPKCGYNNPKNARYCRKCDWGHDIAGSGRIPPMYIAVAGMLLGIISIISWYLDSNYIALGAGAVGMVISSYVLTFVRMIDHDNGKIVLVIAAIGIGLSVIGFIFGIDGIA